jgi:hypothetical protein
MIGRRVDEDRDQLGERPRDRHPKRSRGGVDILKRRPNALHQRHRAATCRDRIGFRHRFDFRDGFLEPAYGNARTAPAISFGAKPRCELPLPTRNHRLYPAART